MSFPEMMDFVLLTLVSVGAAAVVLVLFGLWASRNDMDGY